MEPLDEQQQIGYLISEVKDLRLEQDNLRRKVDNLHELIMDKFKTAELTLRIFKFIGLVVVAVLTFKFGDISKLWSYFFG